MIQNAELKICKKKIVPASTTARHLNHGARTHAPLPSLVGEKGNDWRGELDSGQRRGKNPPLGKKTHLDHFGETHLKKQVRS